MFVITQLITSPVGDPRGWGLARRKVYLIGVSRRREGEGSSQESGRGEMEKVEGDERKWTTVGWERKMIGERER